MLKRSLLKNRLGSEPEGARQNISSTLEAYVKSNSNISRICTMSALISKKPSTEYGKQLNRSPYNISANLVRPIEHPYDKATSAVQMNGSMGE